MRHQLAATDVRYTVGEHEDWKAAVIDISQFGQFSGGHDCLNINTYLHVLLWHTDGIERGTTERSTWRSSPYSSSVLLCHSVTCFSSQLFKNPLSRLHSTFISSKSSFFLSETQISRAWVKVIKDRGGLHK